jgi:hypothetical protein
MPRKSPYVIDLTKVERAELEARSKDYTSAHRNVVRAKIVLLAGRGLGNDRIAARLDMPRQIVSKWCRRFYLQRLAGLEEQPRSAAAGPLFPPSVVVAIKALACELPCRRGLPLSRWVRRRIERGGSGERHRCTRQRRHPVALAQPGCVATLAPSQLDLPARSAVRSQSRLSRTSSHGFVKNAFSSCVSRPRGEPTR